MLIFDFNSNGPAVRREKGYFLANYASDKNTQIALGTVSHKQLLLALTQQG